jgi:hypothetical protein
MIAQPPFSMFFGLLSHVELQTSTAVVYSTRTRRPLKRLVSSHNRLPMKSLSTPLGWLPFRFHSLGWRFTALAGWVWRSWVWATEATSARRVTGSPRWWGLLAAGLRRATYTTFLCLVHLAAAGHVPQAVPVPRAL